MKQNADVISKHNITYQHHITPRSVHKRIKDLIDGVYNNESAQKNLKAAQIQARYDAMNEIQLAKEIQRVEKKMLSAAKNLELSKQHCIVMS